MWNSSLSDAYLALHIDNHVDLTDEDVGVAFYKQRRYISVMEHFEFLKEALEFIAVARKSRFLRFLATIGEHLNEKNVAVLAKKTFPAPPEPEDVSKEVFKSESAGEGPASGELSQNSAAALSESEMEMDAYGEYYATSEDSPSQAQSPSSSEASINSSTGMSADSDFSEEVSGMFFDQHVWRCEECSTMLVDWKCPNGHDSRRCETCGWQLDRGPCQRCLGICGARGGEKVDDQCGRCEESEDEDFMAFDAWDNVWRCTYCQWEVEADSETDGNCRCRDDMNEAYFIDLSNYLDYEPADSCSSEADSTDSEPKSDDEGVIDATEIPIDGIASNAALDAVGLAALYPAVEVAKIMEAAKVAKGAGDKENVEPTASSDDIEIVDATTADGPAKLPSNIIDCESMDM